MWLFVLTRDNDIQSLFEGDGLRRIGKRYFGVTNL